MRDARRSFPIARRWCRPILANPAGHARLQRRLWDRPTLDKAGLFARFQGNFSLAWKSEGQRATVWQARGVARVLRTTQEEETCKRSSHRRRLSRSFGESPKMSGHFN